LLSASADVNIASTQVIEQPDLTVTRKFMQIATHKSLKPTRVPCASGAGKWAVPGKMRNFQSLALGDPGVATTQ
jgi:hypothetical protein